MNSPDLQWDRYADVFSPITSRYQSDMYDLAAKYAYGSVIDCGCGAAKLAPYLTEYDSVTSYLGVDSSIKMIELANVLLSKLDKPNYTTSCNAIEQTTGEYDCAISLQSYYSWTDKEEILNHIFNILAPGGTLILGTVNAELDAEKLLRKASNDLLMYPGWDTYSKMNRELAHLSNYNFCTLDELVDTVRRCGFKLKNRNIKRFL